MRIEILGVNQVGLDAFNDDMTEDISLSWLQDTSSNMVWRAWNVSHRDVFILDGLNRITVIYNLTVHDLVQATNREAIKGLFLSAARFVDSDGDQLGDDWEQLYFRSLSPAADGDDDRDGQSNLMEYLFGTHPKDALSRSSFVPALVQDEGNTYLQLTFRRRAGDYFQYLVETSTDMIHWSASEPGFNMIEPFHNLFDRTGTGRSVCRLGAPVEDGGRVYLRVRGEARSF